MSGNGAPVEAKIVDEKSSSKTAAGKAKKRSTGSTKDASLVYAGALQRYLAELRQYPLLTRDEELEHAVNYYENADPKAAYNLVTGNLRLVVKIAMEYQRAFIQVMDLIQEGNIGLMQAVKKFNPYKGVKLSSYAAWWIKAYILRYILNNWRMVKIGTTQAQRKLFFNLQKEKERLEAQGYTPTPQLIAERLDVPAETVVEMEQRLGRPDLSIDAPAGEDGKGTVGDLIPGGYTRQDEVLGNHQEIQRFREALAEFEIDISDKDAFILHHRLLAEEPLTLQEIGDHLGVTRERVRQLEARLLQKMRVFLEERGLRPV
ncbi:MAG: RNA polymerase factor sigma-32 [Candidatus Lernaella stagnicola]|nr:RNA polymerase factor sigma-32 [Candidatus Lernaella stagnicola]